MFKCFKKNKLNTIELNTIELNTIPEKIKQTKNFNTIPNKVIVNIISLLDYKSILKIIYFDKQLSNFNKMIPYSHYTDCKSINEIELYYLFKIGIKIDVLNLSDFYFLFPELNKNQITLNYLHTLNISSILYGDISKLILGCPELRNLNISKCYNFSNNDCKIFSLIPKLIILNMSYCSRVTSLVFESLKYLKDLEDFNVSGCFHICNQNIQNILKNDKIKKLLLENCWKINDESFEYLPNSLEQLNILTHNILSEHKINEIINYFKKKKNNSIYYEHISNNYYILKTNNKLYKFYYLKTNDYIELIDWLDLDNSQRIYKKILNTLDKFEKREIMEYIISTFHKELTDIDKMRLFAISKSI